MAQLTRRSTNNDMTFGQGLANFTTSSESVAQNIVTRLRTYQGEWFMDTSFGIPYFQNILVKPDDIPLTESLLKAAILETDGVDTLDAFSLVVNTRARTATVTASVSTIYGTVEGIQITL